MRQRKANWKIALVTRYAENCWARLRHSTIQFLTLGLLVSFLLAGLANAAPLYRGRVTLPYEVRWGHSVLPAGDYLLSVESDRACVFVVIQGAKSGRNVALLMPLYIDEEKGTSALFIAGEGNQRVVQALSLAELGKSFVYEFARGATDVREAHTMQTISVVAANK